MIDYPSLEIKEKLSWSILHNWDELSSQKVPKSPGVYEVLSEDGKKCLDIGMSGNLNKRLRQLTKKGIHSTRERMAEKEQLNKLKIRWAVTKSPAAFEEYLHRISDPKPEYSIIKKYLR